MKLSISNIAWPRELDREVYAIMQNYGFFGLEIAPTAIFPDTPYDRPDDAQKWSSEIKKTYGFTISSMQSIWYGRQEKLFGSVSERGILTAYTKKAIAFAEAIGCGNLVFGCPRNRSVPEGVDVTAAETFFSELASYAAEHGTVLSMEANPPLYNTNYINTTAQALELVSEINSPGFKLNLDTGTMIENNEEPALLDGCTHLINHVHISEPNLLAIQKRPLHKELAEILKAGNYHGFISVEMGAQNNLSLIEDICAYIREVFV